MRQVIFVTILIIVAFGVGFGIWGGIFGTAEDGTLMHTMYKGGPLVVSLIALLIMLFGFIIERAITLYKVAAGKSSVQAFFKKVVNAIQSDDYRRRHRRLRQAEGHRGQHPPRRHRALQRRQA